MRRTTYKLNFLELLGLEGHIFTRMSFNLKYIFPAIYITLLTYFVPAVYYQGKWNNWSTYVLIFSLIGLAVNVVIGSKVKFLNVVSGILQPVYAYTTVILFALVSGLTGFDWLIASAFTVFGVIYWWIPSAGMSNAIRSVANGVIIANEGNLTHRIRLRINRKDEIGMLAGDLNTFFGERQKFVSILSENADHLASTGQQMLSNAREATTATQHVAMTIEQVAKGAAEQSRTVSDAVKVVEQVVQAIEQIAAGAQEQSRNVIDTTGMVDEVVKKVEIMAEGMEAVKQVSEQNGVVAVNGGAAVEKTVNGMLKVKEAVFETAKRIHDLGEQSQKIGEIIQVIDEIAEQTNLLALNAAIEAARAGEHGKGFAVVADEVRKLAERSGEATKEIADLINDIQRGTKVAVDSMQIGTREVEEGVTLAQEAGGSLNEIVEGVKAAGENVHKIMGLISDILTGSQQVSRAINNVAAITQENTASTQQMSASAQEVNSLIRNIAAVSKESASAAGEVSASTEQLTASVDEITVSAEQLDMMAHNLQGLVGDYTI